MTTTAIIATIAAVIAAVVLVVWMRSRKTGGAVMPISINGLGIIGYNKSAMDRTSAEDIATELYAIKRAIWPELLRIYQTGVEYPISVIVLDPVWVDPKHSAGIKAVVSTGTVKINPSWKWGSKRQYTYRHAFGAELHSVIRKQLYGNMYDKTIDKQDVPRIRAATALWQAL